MASFISFEGGEGTGKSTQCARLAARLKAMGAPHVLTREPGGSPGAEAIRQLLVRGPQDRWSADAEALLMYAARFDHVERVIAPALVAGSHVICDRFADSTRAYQGAGGAGAGLIEALEAAMRARCWPDLTLIFDLDPTIGLARAAERAGAETRFEDKGIAFHQRLQAAYRAIARAEPTRCLMIDAGGTPEVVEAAVWDAVQARLAE